MLTRPPLSCWTRRWSCILARSDNRRVYRPSASVQGSDVGTVATSITVDRGNVQWVSREVGSTGKTGLHTSGARQQEVITN